MNLNEKVAYLKGLSDGLKLDEKKDEVKIINAIMDLLSDMAEQITDTTDKVDGLAYTVESIDDELSDLEEAVYDDEDDDECCCDDEEDDDYEKYYHHKGHHHHHHHHDCDDECCCDDEDEDVLYEVTCPTCGEKLTVEEEELLCGETECPNCGEFLEFDFSFLSDDDEDEEKEPEDKTTDETIEKEDTEE
ncbi:MAG: hypothetical protein IJU14_07550 [Clostridia bacterium]|nr:hypothetical protein [Clostridia bacterium]